MKTKATVYLLYAIDGQVEELIEISGIRQNLIDAVVRQLEDDKREPSEDEPEFDGPEMIVDNFYLNDRHVTGALDFVEGLMDSGVYNFGWSLRNYAIREEIIDIDI